MSHIRVVLESVAPAPTKQEVGQVNKEDVKEDMEVKEEKKEEKSAESKEK